MTQGVYVVALEFFIFAGVEVLFFTVIEVTRLYRR